MHLPHIYEAASASQIKGPFLIGSTVGKNKCYTIIETNNSDLLIHQKYNRA